MVRSAVVILPKIWTAWVGRTNVTDETDGEATANSERERELVNVAKNHTVGKTTWLSMFMAAADGRLFEQLVPNRYTIYYTSKATTTPLPF